MNRYFIIFTLFLLSFFSISADEAFIIEHYQINIDVQENNLYEIEEIIEVDFSMDRHGIIRDIPLFFDNRAVKISRINVIDHEYSVDKDSDWASIRIGSPRSYVQGKVIYVIRYHYDVGADKLSHMDEFYHNLIGTDWDTSIESADFSVTLPKSFDGDVVNCTSGVYGSTDNSGVEWSVKGNTVEGKLLRPLNNMEGLTLAIPLPEGYWVGAQYHKAPDWLFRTLNDYPLYAAVVLLAFILWFLKGRDNKLNPTMQIDPPEGLIPPEIGYVIDGTVDTKDVTSLILYWASKGYLSIEEISDEKGKTKELVLTQIQEPGPEARAYESRFYSKLFGYGSNGRVSTEDLKYKFSGDLQWACEEIKNTFTGDPNRALFTKGSAGFTFLAGLLSFLPLFLMFLHPFLKIEGKGPLFILAFVIALGLVILYSLVGKTIHSKGSGDKGGQIVVIAIASLLTLAMGALMILNFKLPVYKYAAAVGSSFIAGFFASIMSRRTAYGDQILEKVLGFKEYISKGEQHKLQSMAQSNPTYFFDVLPYALVLGLSKKWSALFDGGSTVPPRWYRNYPRDKFEPTRFNKDLNRNFRTLGNTLSSTPPSSSSGGSSSGGSSGGGSGGGGGSSW